MTGWRRNRWANPAAYYVFGGLLLLAFTLWVPWLSASRTARAERRADAIAEALLEASHGFTPPYDASQTAAFSAPRLRVDRRRPCDAEQSLPFPATH